MGTQAKFQTSAVARDLYIGTKATGQLNTIAPTSYVDGDYFTVGDGTHAAKKFEPRACAVGSITATAQGTISDNQTLVIGDGSHTVTFEAQVSPTAVAATGSITCPVKSLLLNNETFTLNDGVHTATIFSFKTAANAYAAGSIASVDYTKLVDNDHFILNDGVNTATVFEFKVTGGYVKVGTRTTIDITGLSSNAAVAGAIKNAINGVTTTLAITAGTVVVATTPLTNDAYGAYNTAIIDNTTSGALTFTGMAGGSYFVTSGVTMVDVSALTTAAQVAGACLTAINGVTTTLAITAGTVSVATVPLTNDAVGAYNTAITDTVADAGFTHTGMSGGVTGFTTAGGTTIVDLQAATTAQSVAALYVTAINTIVGGLTVTAGTATAGVFALTNDNQGSAGNVTITGTIGFTKVGMRYGLGTTPVSGAVAVDVTGLTAAGDGASAIATVMNAQGATVLNCFCTASAAGVVGVTNQTPGELGNVTITENVNNAGFTVSGLTGGVDAEAVDMAALNAISPGAVPAKTATGSFTAATLDNIPDGTTAKQYNPAAVAITGGTATDVRSADTLTSGEAVTLGYAVGLKNASGTPKAYKASAASASTPGLAVGIATATVGTADLPLTVQSTGLSPVIPDAAWDALPAVTDVGSVVYLSTTAGKLTLVAPTGSDRVQPVGKLAVGGTGACKVELAIDAPQASATPAAGSVTLAMMANLAANSIILNDTANPATPIAGTPAQVKTLLGLDVPASGVVGTFTGGAASIAPGTDNASRYPIAAALTLSQASALTLATTGSPVVGNKIIACYALSLGYVLSIVNGGPLANTLATFGATLSAPLGVVVYWDGTNYKFNGYVCLS